MRLSILTLVLVLSPAARLAQAGDWPQWRGPERSGVAGGGPKLATTWPAGGPPKLWESEVIPRCDTDGGGGYGSVTVAGGCVYLFTGWGHKQTVPASQPGEAPKSITQSSDVVLCLDAASGKTLWRQEFPGTFLKHMDLYHGSSSTVTVANGRCYVVGTAGVYCLDAKTGDVVWQHPSPPASSSFLVFDNIAVAQLEQLRAFDATTGRELWSQPKVKSHSNSPMLWRSGDKARIICNTPADGVWCVDGLTGEVLWGRVPGGEHSTPAVSSDYMVILAEVFDRSLLCYKLTDQTATKLWRIGAIHDQSASPIIWNDHVYAYANKTIPWGKVNRLICAKIDTGEVTDDVDRGEAYWAMPAIADGKLFFLEDKTYNAAIHLTCFDASPGQFSQLWQMKVDASLCVSPAIADGRLYLRLMDRVACFDLTDRAGPTTEP